MFIPKIVVASYLVAKQKLEERDGGGGGGFPLLSNSNVTLKNLKRKKIERERLKDTRRTHRFESFLYTLNFKFSV